MGVVLEALDVPLQRPVAVKLMARNERTGGANSEEGRMRPRVTEMRVAQPFVALRASGAVASHASRSASARSAIAW